MGAQYSRLAPMSSDQSKLDRLRIDRSSTGSPRKRRSQGGIGWIFIVLVLAGVAVAFYLQQRPKVPLVQTAIARQQVAGAGARTLLNASGYVTARRAATVSSKVTGKVLEVLTEEGKKVEKDQVLARLDATNIDAALKLAEAQLEARRKLLEETKPNLAFAQQELNRYNDLAKTKVVSDSDFRRAEMEARTMSARIVRLGSEIDVAEREVAQWKQQLDDMTIRAPFGGIVTSKNAQPGEMISPMSVGGFTRTGICTIVDMSSLEIEVDVNESYINRVQSGLKVEATLDAYSDWKIPCHVIAIIPTADRQKATVKVRVGFNQLDERILPDMGVKVAFQSTAPAGGVEKAASPRVLVPNAAVQKVDGRDIVWVVKDGRVERRAVTLSAGSGEDAAIEGGLNAGEKVVVSAPAGLHDGAAISEKNP